MKIWTTALLAAGLTACQPAAEAPAKRTPTPAEVAAAIKGDCKSSAQREIGVTSPTAKDVLKAEASGPTCEQATVVYSLRSANGALLWTHAVRASDTWAFVPEADDKPVDPQKGIDNYLAETVKNATVEGSNKAPEWKVGKERPEEPSGLFFASGELRETYMQERAKNTPLLCMDKSMGTGICVLFDPEFPDSAHELYSSSS